MRAEATTPPPEGSTPYALSSELARACLPQSTHDDERKFAWTAAVCVLFLGVGIYGLFTRPVFTVKAPVIADESIPVLFEPPPQPPVTDNPPSEESEPIADKSDPPPAPVVVAVATPSEAAFAVPVVGAVLIAPARLASAPPIDLRAAAAPMPKQRPAIKLFTGDAAGQYPPPTYPRLAQERRMQGKVLLLVAVGPNGVVSHVEVSESSGHLQLDAHAAEWVKSHWVWPPGENRQFHAPIVFELK